jgi:hypothetical protein
VPIEKKSTFLIFGEQFVLGDYSLVYKENTEYSTFAFLGDRKTSGRKYVFYRNKTPLYKVDILKRELTIRISNSAHISRLERLYIKMTDNKGAIKEYDINLDKELPYITYNDDVMGNVHFNYYRSRNKNELEYDWEFFTGFDIRTGDAEYGILALYPPALYLKRYNDVEEKMALYLLAAYASSYYDDYHSLL